MLALDVSSTKAVIQSGISAGQTVTGYAQFNAPHLTYKYISDHGYLPQSVMENMLIDAHMWLYVLGPAYAMALPNLFISYNSAFQKNLGALLQYQKVVTSNLNNTNSKYAFLATLFLLECELETLSVPMTELHSSITKCANDMRDQYAIVINYPLVRTVLSRPDSFEVAAVAFTQVLNICNVMIVKLKMVRADYPASYDRSTWRLFTTSRFIKNRSSFTATSGLR